MVCFVWLINLHYKYRIRGCALFGWSASPTNTGYGGVLCLVDLTRITNAGYSCVLCLVGELLRKIQGMVVCFVWLISPCPTPQQIQGMMRYSLVGQFPLQ